MLEVNQGLYTKISKLEKVITPRTANRSFFCFLESCDYISSKGYIDICLISLFEVEASFFVDTFQIPTWYVAIISL